MGGPWEDFGSKQTPKLAESGPWDDFGAGGEDTAKKYPDWYVRSSDLRAKGYSTDQGNPDISILKKYGFRDDEIARLTKDPTYSPGAFQLLDDLFGKGTRGGEAQATKVGRLSQGLTNLAMGGAQIGSRLNPGRLFGGGQQPETTDAIARIKAAQIAANRNPDDVKILGADPLEVAGQMLVPVPGGGAAKGATLLKALARGAVTGAVSGAMQPVNDVQYDESGNSDFASQKAKGAALGAAGGAAGVAVARGAGAAANRLLGRKVSVPAPKDVTTLGDDLTAKMMKASSDDVAMLTQIAKSGGVRAQAAQELLDEIAATGNDPTRQLQLSAKTKLLTEKLANDEAFAARDKAMQGVKDVPVANTINAINNVIAELKNNPYPGQEAALKELNEFKANLLPKTREVQNGLVDEYGNAMTQSVTTKPKLDFENLSAARATLKDRLRAIYQGDVTGGGGAKNMTSAQYQQIADALSEDLSVAAKKVPGAAEADEAANSLYRAYKQKWSRNGVNRGMVQSQTPDEIMKTFVGGAAKEDRAINAKSALTQTGVESVKSQMLQSAMDASGGDPGKFMSEMKKLQNATGVFFEGEDLARLEGLKKIMGTSSATGKALAAGGGATVGGMVGGPWGAVAGAVAGPTVGRAHVLGHVPVEEMSQIVKKLFMTKAGQRVLLDASRYEPRSPEWERAILEGQARLSRSGGIMGGESRIAPMDAENQ